MIDVMAIKLKVIRASCGICTLSEADLLRRLEELYLEGFAEGMAEGVKMAGKQHSEKRDG